MCVDDDPQVLESLSRDLDGRYGDLYEIEACESAEEAIEVRTELLSSGINIPLYIVDQRMPGIKGIDFLSTLESTASKILLTAYADTEVAIKGINNKCIDFYILKPYNNDLFIKIDTLLNSYRQGYFVIEARTEEERRAALILQDNVFSEEHLNLPYEKGKEIIGNSLYADITEMFVAIKDREMVGTTSLNRINNDYASKFNTIYGLPIEEFYDLRNLNGLDPNIVQIRNAAIKSEYQNFHIGPIIWREIYKNITSNNHKSRYVLILSASEIRDPEHANSVLEALKAKGFYDAEHGITLRNQASDFSLRHSMEEIESTVIPRLLKLYSKIGFKVIGPPVYYQNYQMFDYPMLLDSENLNQPFLTFFKK